MEAETGAKRRCAADKCRKEGQNGEEIDYFDEKSAGIWVEIRDFKG